MLFHRKMQRRDCWFLESESIRNWTLSRNPVLAPKYDVYRWLWLVVIYWRWFPFLKECLYQILSSISKNPSYVVKRTLNVFCYVDDKDCRLGSLPRASCSRSLHTNEVFSVLFAISSRFVCGKPQLHESVLLITYSCLFKKLNC